MNHTLTRLGHLFVGAALLAAPAFVQSAQTPAPSAETRTTGVLVMLSVKPDVERDRILEVMPEEIRATVRLYLAGKIREWYSRSDGRGVVFILGSKDVDEARIVMESLPLSKHHFVDLDYTALAPLTPLRLLLANPAPRQ